MPNPLLRAAALRRRMIGGLDNTGSSGMNYAGAQYSRLTQDWIYAPIASADLEARWDMARLRARARELARNNPYAVRYLEMAAENVVGHLGARLQARVTRPDDTLDRKINDIIEGEWDEWGQPENASADGRSSWVDLQRLAIVTRARDGEALFRELPGYPNRWGYALQPIDPDRLDHTYMRPADARNNEIRMGVEIDPWGRPVNYWLWTQHPYDIQGSGHREREPVPAREIIYLGRQVRPGQTRDISWFAPILLPLRMLNGFIEAELVAARMGASQMGFFIQDDEAQLDPDSPAAGGDGAMADMVIDAEPGSMTVAPAGIKDFKQFAPNHPNIALPDFVKAMVRWSAGGLSVSYNALGNDLESVNYSSIRSGLLSERDHWRYLQQWEAQHFYRRAYRGWLKWTLTQGLVTLPQRNQSRWFEHRFLARGWPWVDPLKDMTAAAASLQLSLDSRSRMVGEEGRDFEGVLHDLREENALAAEYGIPLINVIGTGRVTEKAPAVEAEDASAGGQDAAAQDAEAKDNADTARVLDGLLTQLQKRQALPLAHRNGKDGG